ncbi:hypothetical protein GEV33_000176 [Tenebrio molitor]|uniref:Uncharacterized protein n=1 Tax=Tenebrio molitor TaxID=7067 RepID=A0A8J6HXQ1_TENMO|nr:hypothetical protein GEV33_000176 [Tenebrio molitor]
MADGKRKTLKDLARYELLLDSGSSARDSPGGEINPLKRRVYDPREGSLYAPRRFGWNSSRTISQPNRSSSTGSPAPVAH